MGRSLVSIWRSTKLFSTIILRAVQNEKAYLWSMDDFYFLRYHNMVIWDKEAGIKKWKKMAVLKSMFAIPTAESSTLDLK